MADQHDSLLGSPDPDGNPARGYAPVPQRPSPTPFQSFGSEATVYSPDIRGLDIVNPDQPKTGYFAPRDPVHAPEPESPEPFDFFPKWLPRWFVAGAPMYGLLLLGMVGAMSHHLLYARHDGHPADNLPKWQRYGGVLAIITKACLCGAILFAYKQQLWATVRDKVLQVGTLDRLFSATEDFGALASLEFITKAKVALILVCFLWLFPIMTVLTPPSLSVSLMFKVDGDGRKQTFCPSIRTLNFDMEGDKDWRLPVKVAGRSKISMSLWNTTVNDAAHRDSATRPPFTSTFFDYWDQPSDTTSEVQKLATGLQKVIPRDNVSLEICGKGWNCSYTVTFTAPGYNCELVADGLDDNTEGLAQMGAPFDTSALAPRGDLTYIGQTMLGDYASPQMDVGTAGIPSSGPPFPVHLGAFRTEPVMWLGYSTYVGKSAKPAIFKPPNPAWNSSWIPRIVRCEHSITNYTIRFNHTNNQQTTTILNRTYVGPIVDTKIVPGQNAGDGTWDATVASPESNYLYPFPDYKRYRKLAAMHGLGKLMRGSLSGTINSDNNISPPSLLGNRLIDQTYYVVVPDFVNQVQSYYEDIILSLFSYPQFLAVTWAANPNVSSSVGDGAGDSQKFPCIRTRWAETFVYNRIQLWTVYGIAIVLTLGAVIFGAAALAQNKHHVRQTLFSNIVAATRAPCLDDLPWKRSRWGEVPGEVSQAKVAYGAIVEDPSSRSPFPSSPGMPAFSPSVGSPRLATLAGPDVYYGFAPEAHMCLDEQGHMTSRSRRRETVLSFKIR